MFSYTQTIDGVSGWEEYPVVDVAIKCKDKEESDVSVLIARKEGLVKRLDTIAANRDQGSAGKTADVMADNWNGDPNNGGAY